MSPQHKLMPTYEPMLFEYPVGNSFEEWRENVRKTELYRRGDTVLIWVNEGDLFPGPFVETHTRPTTDKLIPTDAMIKAGRRALKGSYVGTTIEEADRKHVTAIYRAMEAARPTDVSTDGLVGDTINAIIQAARPHDREPLSFSYAQVERGIRTTLAALQRSNAAKDEALRPFALYAQLNDLAERDPDSVIEVPVRDLIAASKALSHSSETSNDG